MATPYRIGVLALVLTTVAWRAWTVSRWTWHVDDWLYLDGTVDHGFVEYLFQDYNGHVMPAGFLVTWVMAKVAPLDFRLAVALVAIASGALVLLWALALRRLAGERTVLLVPLAVLSLSPLLIRPTIWWASALQALPLQLFLAASVLLVVRAAREPRPGDRWKMACAGAVRPPVLAEGAVAPHPRLCPPRSTPRTAPSGIACGARPHSCRPRCWWPPPNAPLFLWRTAGESANSVEITASAVTGGEGSRVPSRAGW